MTEKTAKGKKANNRIVLAVFLLLGICGLIVFATMHKAVFPSAAINLSVPKSDILKLTEIWIKQLGYQKQKIIKSITFNCDDDVKTFLEYELGNAKANDLMQNEIPVFYWDCSFKQEFDQEGMRMTMSPTGELYYFDHYFPNDRAIPDIQHDEAKAKAFDFVLKQTGWTKSDCKLVEDSVDKQLHRNDYDFTWENQKTDYKGAKLRASASFCGNILSGYYKFLKLPESWDRKYETIRSYNNLLQTIATVFYSLLHIAAVFIFFQSIANRQIRWRFVLLCAGILTLVCFLEGLNDIESALSAYDSHKSYAAFLTMTAFGMFMSLPLSFMGIALIVGAAEKVYRLAFPEHLPWQKWFTGSALRNNYVTTGLIIGYGAFGISIGYQILYYALGQKFHFWCPLGIDKYQILTAIQPWFSAFTLGVFASGAEELLYRVIMLGFGQRLLKNFWIANVLQAMAWGFMHSGYPQQPAYARGVELTIEGIFWGCILRRFGLLPCLVSHYLFDVFCDSVPLFSAQILNLRLSPFIPLLPLLGLAIFGLWQQKKKGQIEVSPSAMQKVSEHKPDAIDFIEHQSEPLLKAITKVEETLEQPGKSIVTDEEVGSSDYVYQPLVNSTRLGLLGLICISFIVLLLWKEPRCEIYQENSPLKSTAKEVIKTSWDYMNKNHFDLTGYTAACECSSGISGHKDEYQYILEKVGFERTDAIAHEIENPHLWAVRFFKPACSEEYVLALDKDGKILSQTITKDEDAPGARLSEAEARKIAEDYLHQYRPLYEPLIFSDVEVKNRSHRTDYYFQFKSPKYRVGDADSIVSIEIVGDIPSFQGHRWQIPDEWHWDKVKITLPKALALIATGLVSLASFIAFIWWTVSLFLARTVRWKPAIWPGLVFITVTIITALNYIPTSIYSYNTTIPVPIYTAMLMAGGLLLVLLSGAFMFFCLVLTVAAIKELGLKERVAYAVKSLTPWLNRLSPAVQYNYWLDAILIAGAYDLFSHVYSLARLTISTTYRHAAQFNNSTYPIHLALNNFSPTISELSSTVAIFYAVIIFLSIFIGVIAKFGIRKEWQIFLFIFITTAITSVSTVFTSTVVYWQEILSSALFGIIGSLLYWYFLRKGAMRNILGFLLWLYLTQMTNTLADFIECAWSVFPIDICVLCLLTLLPFFYLIYLKICSVRKSSAII